MSKLIMFRGGVETLTFFSEQIAQYFYEKGFNIFWYDLENEKECARRLRRFIKTGDTYLFTFNFLGLSGEKGVYDEQLGYLWEQYHIPVYNMVVDHPLYYAERYEQLPLDYRHISIDRDHQRFMKEYYSEFDEAGFLPLAGTTLKPIENSVEEWIDNRPVDVLFVGNYNALSEYEAYITRINDEYTNFYRGIISELLHHPERSLSDVARRHCIREMGQLTEGEWRVCFQHLNFIDLYLRFYERQNVLRSLVENGVKVHVYGAGYENMEVKHKENLILHGGVDSLECLRQMGKSKITLNVMPWFREGLHDRILNAMANGSVSFSDVSLYLAEEFAEGEEYVGYDLTHLEMLSAKIKDWISKPYKLYNVAVKAYKKVVEGHLWKHRAMVIEGLIKKEIPR